MSHLCRLLYHKNTMKTTIILLVLTLATVNYNNWLAFIQGIAVAVLAIGYWLNFKSTFLYAHIHKKAAVFITAALFNSKLSWTIHF